MLPAFKLSKRHILNTLMQSTAHALHVSMSHCLCLILGCISAPPPACYPGTTSTSLFGSGLQGKHHKLTKSMFPDAESDILPLERCMRILPHHSDTGGFFIAVFEKVAKYPQPVPK